MLLSSDNNIFSCRTDNGLSSVIGAEVCVIRDFYKKLFPNNYFKSYWIDTKWFSNEIESLDTVRKDKPILAIKPRPNLAMEGSYFGRLPNYWYKNYFIFRNLKDNYCPVIIDEEKGIFIYCLPERMKIDYEIVITTSTRMDMLNTAYRLKGSVLHDSYFYLKDTYLEVEIPRKYVLAVAKKLKYDLNVPSDNDAFEEYLNYKSKGKITKKKKLSSGNFEYFFQYKVSILCRLEPEPSIGDGEGNGQTEDNFTITSNMQTEFWSPFNFFLEVADTDNEVSKFLYNYDSDNIIENADGTVSVVDEGEREVSVNLAFPVTEIMQKEDAIKIDGKQLTIWQGYLTENSTVDVLEFKDALTHEMQEVITYNNANDIDTNEEFIIKVYKEKELIADRYIEVNWNTFSLKNFVPDENSTFHLAIYCDLPSIRAKAEEIRNKKGLS